MGKAMKQVYRAIVAVVYIALSVKFLVDMQGLQQAATQASTQGLFGSLQGITISLSVLSTIGDYLVNLTMVGVMALILWYLLQGVLLVLKYL